MFSIVQLCFLGSFFLHLVKSSIIKQAYIRCYTKKEEVKHTKLQKNHLETIRALSCPSLRSRPLHQLYFVSAVLLEVFHADIDLKTAQEIMSGCTYQVPKRHVKIPQHEFTASGLKIGPMGRSFGIEKDGDRLCSIDYALFMSKFYPSFLRPLINSHDRIVIHGIDMKITIKKGKGKFAVTSATFYKGNAVYRSWMEHSRLARFIYHLYLALSHGTREWESLDAAKRKADLTNDLLITVNRSLGDKIRL